MIYLPPYAVTHFVEQALKEDFGLAGDRTSLLCVPYGPPVTVPILVRQAGVVSGLPFITETMRRVDPEVKVTHAVQEGSRVTPSTVVACLHGPARSLLMGERVALNFLGYLSGIATLTNRYVAAVCHTKAKICDTRKTTPTLRLLERYAVSCGGGTNHRSSLDEAILIKDNHIAAMGGSLEGCIRSAKQGASPSIKILVEVDTLDQLKCALKEGVDGILLDNMDITTIQKAVELTQRRIPLEASGGITLEKARAFADAGIDFISVGALTHSAPWLDCAIDW
jgi:nicotinate-nucleotide pyrophosphorylase (carboxylating)